MPLDLTALPSAGFVYSLLKDIWNSGSTRLRGRRFQTWARGWTVDHWCDLASAAEEFGDQELVGRRQEVWQRREDVWEAMHEQVIGSDVYKELKRQYEGEQQTADLFTNLIYIDLREQLARGELTARGFREPHSHGVPSLTIRREEWPIIMLEPPDRAEGAGIGYVGLTIGKVGTKSLFRRLKP
jgi:hypothetical protein